MSPSPNARPYKTAFTWGAIWLGILVILSAVVFNSLTPFRFGYQTSLTMMAAGIQGFIASRNSNGWSFTKVGLWYPVTLLVVMSLAGQGAAHNQ